MNLIKLYKIHDLVHEVQDEMDVVEIHRKIAGQLLLSNMYHPYIDKLDETLFGDEPEDDSGSSILKMDLDEITPEKLLKVPDKELLLVHLRLHQLYNGNYKDKQRLIDLHRLVVGAMLLRGMKVRRRDELDESLFVAKEVSSPMVWIPDFISISGSTVNSFREPRDVDLVVRGTVLPDGKIAAILDPSIALKIERLVRNLVGREDIPVHWNVSSYGSNSSYLDLFDLVLVPKVPSISHNDDELMRSLLLTKAIKDKAREQAERAKRSDKITPGEFFYPLKTSVDPLMGYHIGERYSVEQGVEFFEQLKQRHPDLPGVYIEKKLDGIFVMCHWLKDKLIVYTDGGQEIAENLPDTFAKQAKEAFGDHTVIVIGELELWRGGKHVPREEAFGLAKRDEDKGEFTISLFDCVYYDEDLHKKPYQERRKVLESFEFESAEVPSKGYEGFLILPTHFASTPEQVKDSLQHCFDLKGSEGAMMKIPPFAYTLNRMSDEIVKVKKYADFHAAVISREETKKKGVYNYWFGLEFTPQDKIDPKTVVEAGGLRLTKVGKTFNSNLKLEPGDIITVVFHNLNVYVDSKTGLISLTSYENHLKEFDPDEDVPDTVATVIDIAEKAGLLNRKVKDENDRDQTVTPLEKDRDPYTYLPEEKLYPYVAQIHFRGRSAHMDWRVGHAWNGNIDHWIGFTLMVQEDNPPIPEPVTTMALARKYIDDLKYWKINLEAMEFGTSKTRSGVVRRRAIYTELKETGPLEWLTFEGVMEPGNVGATMNYPGVFVIVDKGYISYGAWKTYFKELFVEKGKMKGDGPYGRYVIRSFPKGALQKFDTLQIKFLGTLANTDPFDEHKNHTGILVYDDKYSLLFDVGEFSYLEAKPSAIFLTHLHDDHINGLKGTSTLSAPHFSPEPYKDFTVIHEGQVIEVGSFKIVPYTVEHSERVKTFGYRVEHTSGTLISVVPDHGNLPTELIKGVKIAILDGSTFNRDIRNEHLAMTKSIKAASDAGVQWVIYTHIGKWNKEIEDEDAINTLEKLLDDDTRVMIAHDSDVVKIASEMKEVEKAERDVLIWLTLQSVDLRPYVLSKDALESDYIPPQGHSCLPESLREKVPSEFRYWVKEKEAERRAVLEELTQRFKVTKEGEWVER
jgi:ribonuclease BN (tRNA processing enzyme)